MRFRVYSANDVARFASARADDAKLTTSYSLLLHGHKGFTDRPNEIPCAKCGDYLSLKFCSHESLTLGFVSGLKFKKE